MIKKDFKKKFGKDLELSVSRMSARAALELKFQLVQLLGDVFGALVATFTEEKSEEDMAHAIANIVQSVKGVDRAELLDLLEELTEQCYVLQKGGGSSRLVFDFIFSDRPLIDVYKVAFWVLEVNYKDFFSGRNLPESLQKLMNPV